MKFTYPYKLYILGLLLLLSTFTYGIFVLNQIHQEGFVVWPFVLILCITCFYLARFYLMKIRLYKDRHLTIDEDHIYFHLNRKDIHINADDLDVIFYARHLQNLKIHHVIHFFKHDGTYFFITDEINHFKQLKSEVSSKYPHHYYEASHLIKGFQSITKGLLFTYR
ncbi:MULTISPECIES: hypothetical protein [unclassified Fusibacter]|uniref:hypothetical protein n=1 Tax=unclassified Fusibacter TaxID=2624464 RepID=UPI001011C508|nr:MULTISPECIES: hypothetical protein [unclassified Fusibacter]MCK8060294.1 hypothetical protein [Fusibacter sp. A2]NPE20417.1 hypothetical protein [Fusibacter sp. A1]RXV63622.1 hypothetical protein DWB64_01200 [Fusibacter sp. A1]